MSDDRDDTEVSSTDTSAATSYMKRGEKASPYLMYPERETYTEIVVMRRQDGTRYRRVRSVSRWAGSFSYGEWQHADTL